MNQQQVREELVNIQAQAEEAKRQAGKAARGALGLIQALDSASTPPTEPPVEPDPPVTPTDPPVDPTPPVEVEPGVRTYHAWAGSWTDDTGRQHSTSNGQSGLAAALNAGTRNGERIRVVWHGSGSLEIANNRPGTKRAVDSSAPIDCIIEGGALTGLFLGEEYLGGAVNRNNPAIKSFRYTDGTLDLRGATTPYPVVSALNTRQGFVAFSNIEVLTTGGVSSKVKSAIRLNGSAPFYVRGIRCLGGTNEYVVYGNYGPGETYVHDIEGHNNGRGIVQLVYRTTENRFAGAYASDVDYLGVGRITARDNGGKDGSSAVSITGWGAGAIYVEGLDVQTHWNAGGLSLRYDIKQADVTGGPGSWQRVGDGFLLPGDYAHNDVIVDLAGSTIINGDDNPGQTHKSSREQVLIDSCRTLNYRPGKYGGKGSGERITNIGQRL